ncbi:DNA-directed RNA polymerase subunit L [Candidatus Parvarchaeota archaeon]|nr:DNA-directed RNA polymerase subunit L [Candidatus Parvarchaeota archaeon]
MKINFLAKETNYVEMVIEGEEHSLPNALREIIAQDSDVEFAAYTMDHPQIASPKLIVRTKNKNALSVIREAIKELAKQTAKFKDEFAQTAHAPRKKSK